MYLCEGGTQPLSIFCDIVYLTININHFTLLHLHVVELYIVSLTTNPSFHTVTLACSRAGHCLVDYKSLSFHTFKLHVVELDIIQLTVNPYPFTLLHQHVVELDIVQLAVNAYLSHCYTNMQWNWKSSLPYHILINYFATCFYFLLGNIF